MNTEERKLVESIIKNDLQDLISSDSDLVDSITPHIVHIFKTIHHKRSDYSLTTREAGDILISANRMYAEILKMIEVLAESMVRYADISAVDYQE